MNIRQWLGRARSIDAEMKALEIAKEKAEAAALKITQSYDGDGATSTKDPHKLDRIVVFIDLLDQKKQELIETQREITEAIYKLDDGRQRTTLLNYYVNLMTLEEISVQMHYSYRQTKRIKNRATEALEQRGLECPHDSVV